MSNSLLPFDVETGGERQPPVADIPGFGKSRPSPLEEFVSAKADLDGLDAQRDHYHARYVKTARKALQFYTHAELAELVGVSRQVITRLVSKGKR